MKLISKKSNIPDAGFGLFSKKYFKKGDLIVTYFGTVIPKEDMYEVFFNNKEKYIKEIHPFIRDISDDIIVFGQVDKDMNKCGVLVNDYTSLKSTDKKDIEEYVKLSLKNANVRVTYDNEYPEYVALRRIKKNEEIYVHYGVGYWLLSIGISPQDISKMNQEYNFDNYY